MAKNDSSINKSGFLPTVSTSDGANYNNSNQEIERQDGSIPIINGAETKSFNASINLNSTSLNAGINLSWNLFDGGNTKTRVANAKIALENQKIL